MSNKYYHKEITVREHTRFDPRLNKRVGVGKYPRKQRYRNYEDISMSRAKELFNQRSQRARSIDLSSTSKKVFTDPNEYWEKHIDRSDVKGIDTKTEKQKDFAKMNLEDLEKYKDSLDNKIKDLRQEYEKYPLNSPEFKKYEKELSLLSNKKDEIKTQIYNEKYLKGNNIREFLERGDIKKIDYTAQLNMPSRYKQQYNEVDLAHKEIHKKLEELSTNEVELYNLKTWKKEGLEVSEETLSSKKEEQKELKNKLKQSFKDLKEIAPKFKVNINEFEKEIDLLNKNKHKFFDKDEELPIIDMGSGYIKDCYTGKLAVMDSLRISLLTTEKGYKGIEALYNATKDGKKVSLDNMDSILTKNGSLLYNLNNSQFSKERIDNIIEGFGDQKFDILFTEEAPLVIRNEDLVCITAPRFSEKDDDDITIDYNKPGKIPRYGYEDIKISQEDFNRIKKTNTKKKLIEKANLPKEYSKYHKDKLIYHYIIEQKTY